MRKLIGLSALSLPAFCLAFALYPMVTGHSLPMHPSQTQFGELVTIAAWIMVAGVALVVVAFVRRRK